MTSSPPPALEDRFAGLTILVVDDDPDIVASTVLALETEGANAISAEDGNTAVSLHLASAPDAVVLDMMLPRRSGFLVLEKIRETSPTTPVVMVTANRGRRHLTFAENLGVSAYLVKPVPLVRLLDTLAELLQSSGEEPTTS